MDKPWAESRNWEADLELAFAPRNRRTELARVSFRGPLGVQRLFHPEPAPSLDALAAPAHCYVLHPPGGLAGGDSLRISLSVRSGAHALVTTPAAGKIYRTAEDSAGQSQKVEAEIGDGALEWLPRETIAFSGARAETSLTVRLNGRGRFIGWEILTLGRAASRLPFSAGRMGQRFRLEREGSPLLAERLEFEAGDAWTRGDFGLGRCGALLNFWAAGRAADHPGIEEAVARIKNRLASMAGPADGKTRAGATFRDGVAVVRYLGNDGRQAFLTALAAWETIRPALLGRPACRPRIWNL
ncbi:MAG: urease accessory protein UreD [Planctomycetota bacterium]|jgi:urease accessory protein|nr:urease accessory protein UreD [Planctomycetota bacterium]